MMDDDEKRETLLEEDLLIHRALGMDRESFDRYRANTAAGFVRFGDYFLRCIGKAINAASLKDAVKLLNIFQNESAQASISYRIYVAREEAKSK